MNNPNESQTLNDLSEALQDAIGKVEDELEKGKETALEAFNDLICKVENKTDSITENVQEAIELIKAAHFKLDNLDLESYGHMQYSEGDMATLQSHIDEAMTDLENATDYLTG